MTSADEPAARPVLPVRRWLGLFAVALTALGVCVWLGLWQLGVARSEGAKEVIEAAAHQSRVDVTTLMRPQQQFDGTHSNRPVSARGTWQPARTVLVVDHRLGARTGFWVATPLRVEATGANLVVLRGFVPGEPPPGASPAQYGAGPTGPVTVTGTLAPGEAASSGEPLPPGQLRSLDLGKLVNDWAEPTYDAMVFASAEQPTVAPTAATRQLQRVPPPPLPSGLSWRNAAYAVQWWVFGAFCLVLWWKIVREERARILRRSDGPETAEEGDGDPDAAAASKRPETVPHHEEND